MSTVSQKETRRREFVTHNNILRNHLFDHSECCLFSTSKHLLTNGREDEIFSKNGEMKFLAGRTKD